MLKQEQAGFSLIELAAVVVIIGILAALAAPKLLGLQGKARVIAVRSTKAAMQSACTLVHAKVVVKGRMEEEAILPQSASPVLSGNVKLRFGYPENMKELAKAMETEGNRVSEAGISLRGYDLQGPRACGVSYRAPLKLGEKPTFEEQTEGCLLKLDSDNVWTFWKIFLLLND